MMADFNQATFEDDLRTLAGQLPERAVAEQLLRSFRDLVRQQIQGPEIRVYTLADAWADQQPVEWVVERLFARRSLNLLYGNPGAKKTWVMLDCAFCVALGKPWLGRPVRQSPVLILDEESGPNRLAGRLGLVGRGHDAAADTPIYYTSLARFNFHAGWHQAEAGQVQRQAGLLRELITRSGAQLVFIDALADVAMGADENSVRDMQPVFALLRTIADESGAALVIIHHAGKAGTYRGSSAISGAVDMMLEVRSGGESPFIDMSTEKPPRDADSQKLAAHIHFWTGEGIALQHQRVYLALSNTQEPERVSNSETYVLRYLREHGKSTIKDIMSQADICSPESARLAVYSLAKGGRVQRVGTAENGRDAVYALVDRYAPTGKPTLGVAQI